MSNTTTFKPTEKNWQAPSDEFERAITSMASAVIQCEFCNRVHFALEGDGYEEGELEGLQAKAKENPNKYLGFNCHSISWGYLDGRQFVEMCPCHYGRAFEEFIWNHRFQILDYLSSRINKERMASERNSDALEATFKILEGSNVAS